MPQETVIFGLAGDKEKLAITGLADGGIEVRILGRNCAVQVFIVCGDVLRIEEEEGIMQPSSGDAGRPAVRVREKI